MRGTDIKVYRRTTAPALSNPWTHPEGWDDVTDAIMGPINKSPGDWIVGVVPTAVDNDRSVFIGIADEVSSDDEPSIVVALGENHD